MSEIKEKVRTLATSLKEEFSYDPSTHTIAGEKSFENHLPDGLDMKTVEGVHDYEVQFVAASGLAVGQMAIEAMAMDKGIDKISGSFNMGKRNEASHVVTREKKFTNIADPKSPIHKHGDLSTTYTVYAGLNQGELKKVRAELHGIAEEQLNKK